MVSIAALIRDPQIRRAVVDAAGGERQARFCANGKALAGIAAEGGLRGIVVEWREPGLTPFDPTIRVLKAQPDGPPLVVYGPLTVAWARDLLALTESDLDVRAVLRGFEDLGPAVRALRAGPRQQVADPTILRRIAPLLRPHVTQIVVAAVVAGKRRLEVKGLAKRCGLATRSMERRLAQAHLLPAWRLLGWCTSLHGVWGIDLLEWGVKRAASELGFRSSAAFSSYVRRHTGATLRDLRSLTGFSGLLERFAALLGEAGTPGNPDSPRLA